MLDADKKLKQASGDVVVLSNKLAGFLHDLMRDHLTCGQVEILLGQQEYREDEVEYSNGWLANYALYLANQLCPQKEDLK